MSDPKYKYAPTTPEDPGDDQEDEEQDEDGLPVNYDDEPNEDYRNEGIMWGGMDV